MATQSGDTVRLSVNLSPEVAEALKELARLKGKNLSDTIRDAIGTEAFIDAENRNESKIMIREKDGTLKQVILR